MNDSATSQGNAAQTALIRPGAPLPKAGLSEHPAAVYLARLAPGSRPAMAGALEKLACLASGGRLGAMEVDWAGLRYQHTAALRAALAEQYAPATANKMLSALRGVLAEAFQLGLMSAEDYQRSREVKAVRGSSLPAGRALAASELRSLLENCGRDRRAAGRRDGALVALLYGSGLRRAEAVSLDLADYHAETGTVTVRAGKGRKARLVYARGGVERALSDWLAVRGIEDGPLFLPISKAGTLISKRLGASAVLKILRRRGKKAGVGAFSPHDLRRTFIGDLLDAGADISTVQRLAGHASVTTTARYDRRGEASKLKASELLFVPYFEPAAGAR